VDGDVDANVDCGVAAPGTVVCCLDEPWGDASLEGESFPDRARLRTITALRESASFESSTAIRRLGRTRSHDRGG
jgi:hypothetical protein